MYRFVLLALIFMFLFSCSNNPYEKYENTKWTGPYGPWHMSLIIDKVEGTYFEGEMHKPAGRIAYFEGTFSGNDSLTFTELYHVLGQGLTMNGTYPGIIVGDTLKGICNFFNVPLPDESLHRYTLIKDKTFTEKTAEQKRISKAFQKTKHITKKIGSLAPAGYKSFNKLDASQKSKYADLVRKKRDILTKEYESIQDDKIHKMVQDQFFNDTYTIWRLAKDPRDSTWLLHEIDKAKEGQDGYYRMQHMKLRVTHQSFEQYTQFLKDMLVKKLVLNDQIQLLYDLLYASERNPEFESEFQQRYAALKKQHPEKKELINLSKRVETIATSKRLKVGTKAPDFNLTTLAGKNLKLGDFRKKFVFIDFWGSWCGPCRGEIPNIKKLVNTIPQNKLQVIGLAKDDESTLKKFIKKENIPYPNALADQKLLSAYGISGYPTTFLIGPDGKIAAKNLRGENLAELVQEKIRMYK